MSSGEIAMTVMGALFVAAGVLGVVRNRRRPTEDPDENYIRWIGLVACFFTGCTTIGIAILSAVLAE